MLMMDTVDLSELEGEPIRPLTRAEYEYMASQGYFEDEHVELLFGVVVRMPPIDPAHVASTNRVADILKSQLGQRARVLLGSPYAASDVSEPEPDVLVASSETEWREHPSSAFLVVEVARTSLRRDRGAKARLYSQSNVEEYWIVDHDHARVEVFRDPHEGIWRVHTTHPRGDTISMLRFPDVTLAVDDVLPPPGV